MLLVTVYRERFDRRCSSKIMCDKTQSVSNVFQQPLKSDNKEIHDCYIAELDQKTKLIHICYLPAASVRMRKTVPEVLKTARGVENGPSPKGGGRFQDRGHGFSHPDRSRR